MSVRKLLLIVTVDESIYKAAGMYRKAYEMEPALFVIPKKDLNQKSVDMLVEEWGKTFYESLKSEDEEKESKLSEYSINDSTEIRGIVNLKRITIAYDKYDDCVYLL